MHDRIRQPLATLSRQLRKTWQTTLVTGLVVFTPSLSQATTLHQNTAPASPWVWTLYDDTDPLVLALEVPDTPRLKTTLECPPRSGRVLISLYDPAALGAGPVTYRSGANSGSGEAQAHRGRVSIGIATTHPAFVSFLANGVLEFSNEDRRETLSIEAAHLAKLRRFSQACAA